MVVQPTTSAEPLGVAIWGAGWVAGAHARAYQTTPGARVVAVGSWRSESARGLAAQFGWHGAHIHTDFAE
jgi:predicted dehydrogenase